MLVLKGSTEQKKSLTKFPDTSKVVKNTASRRIFNSFLGVWKCGQTPSFVFDILLKNTCPLHGIVQ